MRHAVDSSGLSVDDMFGLAYEIFRKGVRIDAYEDGGERFFLVRHARHMGASAVALPDFYDKASGWAESRELFVGFTDPSALFVAGMNNDNATRKFQEAVQASDY